MPPRCAGRKETTCKLLPEECIWEDKCKKKDVKENKQVHCVRRKEPNCEKASICKWADGKCITKIVVPKKVVKVSCGRRKEPNCEKASICKWANGKCSTIHTKTPTVLSPPKLNNRHCMFYGMNLKHESSIDLNSRLSEPYDPQYKNPYNVHIGQRKLMLSEIQMLNEYYMSGISKKPILLYVGAAPGHHLILLSMMFPNVFFILYDGAKFVPILKRYPDVYDIHEGENGFVTTDVIKKIKPRLQK
ncbi:MAG: hypothetical protein EBS55_13370, partial [Flavobacteriaceae bacterium]|nr:hypothetical protein [Flavobacteriaceae bacterium]